MAVATITTALSTFQITRNNSLQFCTLLSSRSSEFITSSSQSLLLIADNNKLVVAPWIQQSSSLHVTAEANSATRKKEKSEPRYSKAARRFYNENFSLVSEQRLSKLLAAAGDFGVDVFPVECELTFLDFHLGISSDTLQIH